MAPTRTVVTVLQVLRRLHPEPWYYRRDPIQDGVEFTNLPPVLQFLQDEGLIEKAPHPASGEKGVRLTPLGRRVADDEAALGRLRGEPLDPTPTGQAILAGLRSARPPWATRALVALNVGFFLYGLYLASRAAVVQAYFAGAFGRPDARYLGIIREQGAVSGADLLDGQWWRVLAANFVHFGLLHIAMNLYALWNLGAFVERGWGAARYLGIVFASAVGTVCLAMAYSPQGPAAGASGIDCGIIGASAVFALLYSRHLPREVASSLWWMVGTNVLLMVVIGVSMGRGSNLGHLGGGLAGAAAALLLHFQRFGGPVLRVAGWLAVPLVCWGAFAWMQSVRADSEPWEAIERRRLDEKTMSRVKNVERDAKIAYQEEVEPLIETHASRREAGKVAAAAEAMAGGVGKLRSLSGELKGGPYRNKEVLEAVDAARDLLDARAAYYAEAVRFLEAGERWTKADEKAHEKMWGDVTKADAAWKAALKGRPKRKKAD